MEVLHVRQTAYHSESLLGHKLNQGALIYAQYGLPLNNHCDTDP